MFSLCLIVCREEVQSGKIQSVWGIAKTRKATSSENINGLSLN